MEDSNTLQHKQTQENWTVETEVAHAKLIKVMN